MRNLILISTLLIAMHVSYSQETRKIYDPQANAKQEIFNAISKAKKENKHVFIQIGFNRCPWCQLFHDFIANDKEIDSLVNANFVKAHIFYGKENKNPELMKLLEYPNRFGFPVFVILDSKGRRLHTQNSAYLEEGKGYNRKEVLRFFKHWAPAALDDKNYE